MLKLYNGLPSKEYKLCVAVSGGIDSMALANFVSQCHANRMMIIHINHKTEYADSAEAFVREWAASKNIPILVHKVEKAPNKGMSKEDFWRKERYKFFNTLNFNCPHKVLLGHHLNDAMETWVFSCMNGTPSLIQYEHGNCIRPFLLSSRADIEVYAKSKQVPYLEDPSNKDIKFARNRIRHNIIPEILQVNPGLEKVIFKKLKQREKIENNS